MKQSSGLKIPIETELEVSEILLTFKSEHLRRYTFTWGRTKKRSVLLSKSESSPLTLRKNDEKSAVAEADKSPSTPLCFGSRSGSGSGSDGGGKPNQSSSLKKNWKRKAIDDLLEKCTGMEQQRESEKKAIEKWHQNRTAQNPDLKAIRQEINYSENIEDFRRRNNPVKVNPDQQQYHQKITLFTPPQPHQQHCQQLMVDPNNGKLMAISCSTNSSNIGGRFGLFNQVEPRVKIHGETFDFMASSQPLDQSKYMVMDYHQRVRTEAAARRKSRMLRMKKNKNPLGAMKVSRVCR